jgi:hypothetical protein
MAATQMINQREVSFCVDTLLVETVLCDDRMYKKAGLITDLLSKVKTYFMAHIDKEHPVESVLKLLAPGALWLLMQGIGLGKWGFFLGLLTDYLHIDIPGMLGGMFSGLKDEISSGKKMSSDQIDSIGQQVAQQHATADTGDETALSNDHRVYTSLELLEEARFMRLALIQYERQKMRLLKEGGDENNLFGFGGARSRSTSLLAKIIGWIFKLALASAGLMVAGDVANTVMGNPSALSGTYQEGQTPASGEPAVPAGPVSKQTKFPSKGDSPIPATWPIVNNETNIENMVVQFAKDVYSGLDGKEDLIRNTAGFKVVVREIAWYNVHSPGTSVVMIPSGFVSKKRLVDYFIDDVAAASP